MLMVFLRCGELVLVKVEELVLFPGLSMELRDKVMSLWSREVKWQQGCIWGIYNFLKNLTELSDELSYSGLVASASALHRGGTRSFPCRTRRIHWLCWKLHNLRDRRFNFAHSVVCSVLIVGAWVILAWCRKGLFGAGWNHVHVWRSYKNFWMHLGEYLVHARLDLATKWQKYTPFAYSWSTIAKHKK